MGDTFFLYKYGELRHGHPQAKPPYTVQFHPAHTNHRVDHGLHDEHQSFTNPKWSKQNTDTYSDLYLSPSLRDTLISAAAAGHRSGTVPNYKRIVDAFRRENPTIMQSFKDGDAPDFVKRAKEREIYEVPQTRPGIPATDFVTKPDFVTKVEFKSDPVTPESPNTYSGDDPDMKLLDERINNVEELIIDGLPKIESRLTTLEHTSSLLTQDVLEHERKIDRQRLDFLERIEQIDVTKQLAPLTARVETLEKVKAQTIVIEDRRTPEPKITDLGLQHYRFKLLHDLATKLKLERRNIWLAGPAGSGKTKAAEMLAKSLGLTYEHENAVDSPYKLTGTRYVTGEYKSTAFRRIYENGGVILLDEVDAGDPRALLAINGALSSAVAAFPDGMVERHPDCIVLCAANTWGFGGDANYVGRVKIDAAFLNRFAKISWQYDEVLEHHVAGEPIGWVDAVQATRALTGVHKAKWIISPRTSIMGAELLTAGMPADDVVTALLGDYMDTSDWPTIGKPLIDYAREYDRRNSPAPAPQSPVNDGQTEAEAEYLRDTQSQTRLGRPRTTGLNKVDLSQVRVYTR